MKSPSAQIPKLLSILILMNLLFSSTILNASSQWRLEKNEESIKVYLHNTPGSAVKSFKANIKIKTSLAALVTIISDTRSYPRWLYNTRSAKELERSSDTELINYVVTNMPWPVADRDVIISSKRSQNPSNKRVQIRLHAVPKFAAKVAGKVRIEKMQGRWLLTPINTGEVMVEYEMNIDPGGNIPKWVVNAMALDLPFNTLKNLKKISKEAQYANAKVAGLVELSQ